MPLSDATKQKLLTASLELIEIAREITRTNHDVSLSEALAAVCAADQSLDLQSIGSVIGSRP